MSEVFKEIKESLAMRQVAEHFGYPVNRSGFNDNKNALQSAPTPEGSTARAMYITIKSYHAMAERTI